MPLTLNLPPLDAKPANPPETRPATIARWLDETLRRDAIDAARVMGDALAALNRVTLPHARRLEIAEKFWAAAGTLWPQLEAKFTRASHPLTGRALEAAKSAVALAYELAVAYKRLLVRQSETRLFLGGTRGLVTLLVRSLQATARVLVNSYLSYSPVPPKTWLDAHAIHAFSRERDLNAHAIAGGEPDVTPERLYLQMLLLALANPYGFLQGELATVIGYVRRARQWAKLTDVPPVHRLAKAVAIIPVGHDFPPFAANKGGAIEGNRMYLLTFELAFELQAQLQALQGGGPLPPGNNQGSISRQQYIALLQRLLRQWAMPPARQFNRVPSRARVLMCPGLPAVWQNTLNAQSGARQVPAGLPPMTHCQVVNQTPAGYALRQTDAAPAALRIGELVAVRVEGRTGMQVALVRWFRNTMKGSGLEFGCELLSEHPEAAVARAEDADDARKTPVVVLPEDPAMPGHEGSPPQLLAPTGAFGLEQAVAIERDTGIGLAVLTKLVEQGPGFELYDYAAVA
jgi:cyclic-di-GMP-binding protein